MPTVLRTQGYRFFFYAGDNAEPPHVHVERENSVAKFWLEPVRLQKSRGFSGQELHQIERLVSERKDSLCRSWEEYFEN